MNHCASWAGNNVSTTRLKKGVQPSKMLNILCWHSVLWKEQSRLCMAVDPQLLPAQSWKSNLLVWNSEQASGLKHWEKMEEDTEVFPVYTGRGIFNKQVINSFQSQEGKSQAVCFLCMKSKLHFHPHLYHYTPCQKIRVVMDISTCSSESQNWKPLPSCHALLETPRNVMSSASDELWSVDLKRLYGNYHHSCLWQKHWAAWQSKP